MARIVVKPEKGRTMSPQVKPSIVFAHGIWADGSCFNKVIPALQAEGYEVASAQYALDTNEGDVAATLRTLGRSYVIQGMRMMAVTWANATRRKSVF